jgi:hypothetical protein
VPDEPVPAAEAAGVEPVEESVSRLRDPETGQFVKPETGEAGTAESGGEEADEVSAAPPVPEGFARIDLPDNHPLRSQGHTYIDVPADQEEGVRAVVNDPVRRKKLERAQHDRDRLNAENAQLREKLAELKARQEVSEKPLDPLTERLLSDIEKNYPKEQAEQVRAALQASTEQEVAERKRELVRQQELYAAGVEFRNQIIELAPKEFHLWGQDLWNRLAPHMDRYVKDVDEGRVEQPDINQFFDAVRAAYLSDPAVRARVEAWRKQQDERTREQIRAEERKRLEDEAAEAEKERLAGRVRRHATNPMGRVPRVTTGVQSDATPPEDLSNMTASQRKKRLRPSYRG